MLQIEVRTKVNLAQYLIDNGHSIKMSCGGNGSCKTCACLIDDKHVLACQTELAKGNYAIDPIRKNFSKKIQQSFSANDFVFKLNMARFQILPLEIPHPDTSPKLSDSERISKAIKDQKLPVDPSIKAQSKYRDIHGAQFIYLYDQNIIHIDKLPDAPFYCLGFDLGTTSLSVGLIHLNSGKMVLNIGMMNSQYAFAEDLAARISFCTDQQKIDFFQDLIISEAFRPLIKMCLKSQKIKESQLVNVCVAGNAPMIHILQGLDPTSMGGYPFNGIDFAPRPTNANLFQLPHSTLELIPAHSAYFGGDLISGLFYKNLAEFKNATLFLDLGTNGEMLLKYNDQLFASAAPAGPSFEGAGMQCGMSAGPGAIDSFYYKDDQLSFTTIKNGSAKGICGSGIISFVANAYHNGILDKNGKFNPEIANVEAKSMGNKSIKQYNIADNIYITEEEIAEFLQAKAAIYSGISTICQIAHLSIDSIDSFYLAGNFGKFFSLQEGIDIGLLPLLPLEKFNVSGNTSLLGACLTTLEKGSLAVQKKMIEAIQFIDLNAEPSFQDNFINALFIPAQPNSSNDPLAEKNRKRAERKKKRQEREKLFKPSNDPKNSQ